MALGVRVARALGCLGSRVVRALGRDFRMFRI